MDESALERFFDNFIANVSSVFLCEQMLKGQFTEKSPQQPQRSSETSGVWFLHRTFVTFKSEADPRVDVVADSSLPAGLLESDGGGGEDRGGGGAQLTSC